MGDATKWTISRDETAIDQPFTVTILDDGGDVVAFPATEEFANLIVTAVNNHQKLLEALEMALGFVKAYEAVTPNSEAVKIFYKRMEPLNAALSSAKGDSNE